MSETERKLESIVLIFVFTKYNHKHITNTNTHNPPNVRTWFNYIRLSVRVKKKEKKKTLDGLCTRVSIRIFHLLRMLKF